jgi:hypothetical protein
MKKGLLDGTFQAPKIPDFPISEWLDATSPKIDAWVTAALDEEESGCRATHERTKGDRDQVMALLDDMCGALGWAAFHWGEFSDIVSSFTPGYHPMYPRTSTKFTRGKDLVIGIVHRLVVSETRSQDHLKRQLSMLWLMYFLKIRVRVQSQDWVNGILVDAGETKVHPWDGNKTDLEEIRYRPEYLLRDLTDGLESAVAKWKGHRLLKGGMVA